jgi:hypothetical protein
MQPRIWLRKLVPYRRIRGPHCSPHRLKYQTGSKSFRAAKNVLAGIELMHMIRKGQLLLEGCIKLSFADQFYTLAGKIRPA